MLPSHYPDYFHSPRGAALLLTRAARAFTAAGRLLQAAALAIACLPPLAGAAEAPESTASPGVQPGLGAWDALLESCVSTLADGGGTAVDYACFQAQETALQEYLSTLSAVTPSTFDSWPAATQLAFLINAYNAFTVELILTAYPDLSSIRDLGSLFSSPWKKDFISLLGDTVSLDDIEHGMIRVPGRYDEPRIHFAVNCASVGCPALRREAYRGAVLEAQLEAQTQQFLGDRSRNRASDDTLMLSPLFKWYRGDFEQGWRGADTLQAFLLRYAEALSLDIRQRELLRDNAADIDFLDYDWSLNDLP